MYSLSLSHPIVILVMVLLLPVSYYELQWLVLRVNSCFLSKFGMYFLLFCAAAAWILSSAGDNRDYRYMMVVKPDSCFSLSLSFMNNLGGCKILNTDKVI